MFIRLGDGGSDGGDDDGGNKKVSLPASQGHLKIRNVAIQSSPDSRLTNGDCFPNHS